MKDDQEEPITLGEAIERIVRLSDGKLTRRQAKRQMLKVLKEGKLKAQGIKMHDDGVGHLEEVPPDMWKEMTEGDFTQAVADKSPVEMEIFVWCGATSDEGAIFISGVPPGLTMDEYIKTAQHICHKNTKNWPVGMQLHAVGDFGNPQRKFLRDFTGEWFEVKAKPLSKKQMEIYKKIKQEQAH